MTASRESCLRDFQQQQESNLPVEEESPFGHFSCGWSRRERQVPFVFVMNEWLESCLPRPPSGGGVRSPLQLDSVLYQALCWATQEPLPLLLVLQAELAVDAPASVTDPDVLTDLIWRLGAEVDGAGTSGLAARRRTPRKEGSRGGDGARKRGAEGGRGGGCLAVASVIAGHVIQG
ncbi:hypothetical protein GUJ93_ZPchr0008g13851 [Zizania palustris]|uniref:Uncharacterized protein n=1 Tax=Zizania palustris TaxID=103762 RepID=A0A8J5RKB7_ZIZPA|nr:hypothetical protein GUJ93_ZPchr0008g13851 [Zizania palustris]